MRFISRRLILGLSIVIVITLGLIILRRPSQSAESIVVLSNLPGNAVNGFSIDMTYPGHAIAFEVPPEADFELVSFQVRLESPGGATVEANLYLANGTQPGAFVASLGTQALPPSIGTVTFTPTMPPLLQRDTRYWVVFENITGTGDLFGHGSGIGPTGIFDYVDYYWFYNGAWGAVAFGQIPLFGIDANPVGSSFCFGDDGRENSVCQEPWQTAAVYCRADGSIEVYGISQSEGWLAFTATQAEIDAVGIPADNTLIEASSAGNIRLYRLSTGEFQVNAPIWDNIRGYLPNGYVFIWDGCP